MFGKDLFFITFKVMWFGGGRSFNTNSQQSDNITLVIFQSPRPPSTWVCLFFSQWNIHQDWEIYRESLIFLGTP
jgi:hypothetical protein